MRSLIELRAGGPTGPRHHQLRQHLPGPPAAGVVPAARAGRPLPRRVRLRRRGAWTGRRRRPERAGPCDLSFPPLRASRRTERLPRRAVRVRARRPRPRSPGDGRSGAIGEVLLAHGLALTLLRATGMLSRLTMVNRPLPAGPVDQLEGPQLQRPRRPSLWDCPGRDGSLCARRYRLLRSAGRGEPRWGQARARSLAALGERRRGERTAPRRGRRARDPRLQPRPFARRESSSAGGTESGLDRRATEGDQLRGQLVDLRGRHLAQLRGVLRARTAPDRDRVARPNMTTGATARAVVVPVKSFRAAKLRLATVLDSRRPRGSGARACLEGDRCCRPLRRTCRVR